VSLNKSINHNDNDDQNYDAIIQKK